MDAYIKLYRGMLDWEWYDDANTCRLFIHCLLRANWKPCKWHGLEIKAGQFITSINTLSNETGLSVHQVRTALDHLMMTGEVASLWQGKYRIITVNNWDLYQGSGKVNGKITARSRQDDGKVAATDKERKEEKEYKENKYYDDPVLDKAFSDYAAMRKQIKKPLTDKAVELAIKKLDDLSAGDRGKAVEILHQSVMNCWQGLFPLKEAAKNDKIHNFTERRYDYKALEQAIDKEGKNG